MSDKERRSISRRHLVAGAAWAVPGLAIARPTEAAAATGSPASTSVAPYLVLGDSIANGFQVPAYWPYPLTVDGYASTVAERLRRAYPQLSIPYVDLACNGETTSTALEGGCQWCPEHPVGDSQLDAAVRYLKTTEGRATRWVSIGLGYNDIGPYASMDRYLQGVDLVGVRNVLDGVTRPKLARAVSKVKAAVPKARIVLAGYHNPNLAVRLVHPDASEAFWQDSITAWGLLHATIKDVARQQRVRYADVPAAFLSSDTALVTAECCGLQEARVAKICEGTWVCENGDGHPNNGGYGLYADAISAALLA